MWRAVDKLAKTVAWTLALAPATAVAQSVAPSQITPPTYRPEPHRGVESRGLPVGPMVVVPPEGDLAVRVAAVRVNDGFHDLAEATDAIVAPFAGKYLKISEMTALALAIEQAYAQAGYVLVRVTIPPQVVKEGDTLTLVVVDGFIEGVDVAAVPEAVRTPIHGRVANLIGRRRLKLAAIERHVLLAGEVAGVRLRSALARGRSEGGTRLILEGDHDRVVGSLSWDNRLTDTFGNWQTSASGVFNSVLGFGEQGYVTLGRDVDGLADPDAPWPMMVFGIGAVIPLGDDGLTLNPEYSRSRTRTVGTLSVPGTDGVMDRWSLRAAYPLVRERTRSLDVRVGAEHINQSVDIPNPQSRLNQDTYYVARGGADVSAVLDGGWWVQFGVTLTQGLGGRDLADAAADGVPLSQQNAGPRFRKFGATARVASELRFGFRGDLFLNGQTSFGEPLLRPEKLSFDGVRGLSSFDSGRLYADSGATLRAELARALPEIAASLDVPGLWFEPYAFAAFGVGKLEAATQVEAPSFEARAWGVGLRVAGPDVAGVPRLRGEVELGHGSTTLLGWEDEWRLSVTVVSEFK